MSLAPLISSAADSVTTLVAEPALDIKREAPAPCADFEVHRLCEHLLGTGT